MAASKREAERRKVNYTDSDKAVQREIDSLDSGAYKMPEGMTTLKIDKPGRYNLTLVPYIVGKDNPMAAEGEVYYHRIYWVHPKVGPAEKTLACLAQNYGSRCPCCQAAAAFKERMNRDSKDDTDRLKSLEPKKRQLFAVIDEDSRNRDMQILEISYHLFGKQLLTAIDLDRARFANFWHLEKGMKVQVNFVHEGDGRGWNKAGAINFMPRNEDLDDKIIDEMPCLDDMIIKTSAAKMEEILRGDVEDEPKDTVRGQGRGERPSTNGADDAPARRVARDQPADEPAPARRKAAAEPPEDLAAKMGIEEDTVVLYKRARCKVLAINRAGTKVDLEDEETKTVYESVMVADCSIPEPEKPARKGRAAKDPEPAPEDDDRPRRTGRTTTSRDDKPDPDADAPTDDDKPRRRGGR